MSIITVIDHNTDRLIPAACIDSTDFTTEVAPWFGATADNTQSLDPSIREQFRDLAEIIEGGETWTDEEAGELCRFLGLTIEFGTVIADLEISNGTGFLDADDEFHFTDTISVTAPQSGDEIARISVYQSEDTEPYEAALRTAGFAYFTWS